jgi:hypothetical protein
MPKKKVIDAPNLKRLYQVYHSNQYDIFVFSLSTNHYETMAKISQNPLACIFCKIYGLLLSTRLEDEMLCRCELIHINHGLLPSVTGTPPPPQKHTPSFPGLFEASQ